MKQFDEMTGIERAAYILVALGPERASDILKHLDEKSVEVISLEVMKVGKLSQDDKEEVLGEFILSLRQADRNLNAGEQSARDILEKAFGSEKSSEILKKIAIQDFDKEFDFFIDADANIILQLIRKESPQMIAVILNYMPAVKSAEVLKMLPKETAKDVALRMARLDSVAQEAVFDLVKRLKERYKKYTEDLQKGFSGEGLDSLVQIMSHMSNSEEQKLMQNLDGTIPEIAKTIKERVVNFESVYAMTNNDIRILIDEINNDYLIAVALKGAGDEMRFAFLRNMSQNRATDLLGEMDVMGAIRKSEALNAQDEIAKIIRSLYESGVIHLKKPGEIYVE